MMDIQTIAEIAANIINQGKERMPMILTEGRTDLNGKSSPQGVKINYCDDGDVVVFNAYDVLAYCIVHGAKINIVLDK